MDGFTPYLIAAGLVVVLVFVAVLLRKPFRKRRQQREAQQAMQIFRVQREQLEAKFFDLACARGIPKGLRWLECDWQNDVTYARDVNTGLLTAFVAVNIHFEAIEGGDMEDVEAVGTVRDAAALFHFQKGHWGTGGRPLFNMNPHDAVERLQGQYEAVRV